MRRLRSRITAAGMLVVLVIGFVSWGVWQKYDNARTTLYVSNVTSEAYLVRVTDGTSGRGLGTIRLDAGTRTLVADDRLDVWWRDITIPERAAGLERGIRLELLGDGCEALGTITADAHGIGALTVVPGSGLIDFVSDPLVSDLPLRQGAVVVAADPCAGRPAPPVAVVQNLRTFPVVLDGRVRVEACSSRTFRPGDAARLLTVAERDGATDVSAPSLAVQKGRWPLETRTVMIDAALGDDDGVVGGPGVEDGDGAAFADPRRFEECGGPTDR